MTLRLANMARSKAGGPIARATIRTSLVLVLRLLVQASTLLIAARLLGPHQFGAFAGVSALAIVLGTLSTLGTNFVLMSEVAREPARRDEVLQYAVPSTLVCGGVLFAIYLLICALAFRDSGITPMVLLAIGATEMWLQPLFTLPAAEHLALGRTAQSQLLITLPLILRLVAVVSVFCLRPSDLLGTYACGYLLASIIALMIPTATLHGCWPKPVNWRLPSRMEIRQSAGYAILNITAAGPAELDKTLAAQLLPLTFAGIYAAGARVIGAATLPVIAMMLSALPRLFREGRRHTRHTNRLLQWLFAGALVYSVLLTAAFWLIAPVFDSLFGEKYQGLDHTIRWLCLAIPGMALRIAAGSVLMAFDKPWIRVNFELAGLIVLVVASTLLTAGLGAHGMPLALACSEWAMSLFGWGFIVANIKNAHIRERNEDSAN